MPDDTLVLDAHTLDDLEVFDSVAGAASLFQFCNLTRNAGGARVLRERMAHPFASASRIADTQAALKFITANRDAFSTLPSEFATDKVEHYIKEILPSVPHENFFAFAAGVFGVWANHERHYASISRGVYVACGFVRGLRRFIEQPELTEGAGELTPLLKEARSLLNDTGLVAVHGANIGAWPLRVLRWDQLFRLKEKASMKRLLMLIYEIDALVSMADANHKHGFTMPTIESGPLQVQAKGVVHPLITDAVDNPIELDQARRVLFLTGPNMAGKTTYLRSVGTALYFAHLGMGVPARSFHFVPAQRLFTTISLSDDLHHGISYFRAEALRAKAVASAIAEGHRVIALMDEPFKGTNVKDALDASRAILQRLATKEDCLFLFSSHLIELRDEMDDSAIDCRYFEAQEDEGKLHFDYRLRRGISNQRLGMRVLQEEGVFDLLDNNSSARPGNT